MNRREKGGNEKIFFNSSYYSQFLFYSYKQKNTLGNPDFSIKKNIPISYNTINSRENISGAEIVKQEKTEEVTEEKTEPVKNNEAKPVPEFESRMTRDKKDIKDEKKDREK